MKRKAIVLHPADDVATALTELKAGDRIELEIAARVLEVRLQDDIAFGHKFALRDIAQGEQILKYGMPILKAQQKIAVGQWVHTHNGRSDRWGPQNQDPGVLPSAAIPLTPSTPTKETS